MNAIEIIQTISAAYVLLLVVGALFAVISGTGANVTGLAAFAGLVASAICAVSVLAQLA